MSSVFTLAKALLALITFLNSVYSIVESKLTEEQRAKLRASIADAKKSTTIDEAASAAQKINDSF